jgi:Flp pilus assembly secretin CpaC
MRRLSLAIAAVLSLTGAAAQAQTATLPVATTGADLPLALGQASYVTADGAVRDVVVADPSVADVSIVNARTLVVLGKRPGVTTLMIFGAGGRPLANRQVVVSEVGESGVTVYRGVSAAGYACAGRCTRVTVAAPDPATASGTP